MISIMECVYQFFDVIALKVHIDQYKTLVGDFLYFYS